MTTLPRPLLRGLTAFMGLMTVCWSLSARAAAPFLADLGVGLGAVLVALALLSLVSDRLAPTLPAESTGSGPSRREQDRVFLLAIGIEGAAIPLAVVLLGRTGHAELIMPAVAMIVGLHFGVFLLVQRWALHVVTMLVGTAGPLVAILLLTGGRLEAEAARAVAGMSLAVCTTAYALAFLMALAIGGHPGPDRRPNE